MRAEAALTANVAANVRTFKPIALLKLRAMRASRRP